jgi:transmembrane sensor
MSLIRRQNHSTPSEEARIEAAAWIARLHDEGRGADADADFQKWLAASDEHRLAFNRMTLLWEQAGKIRMRARADVSPARTRRSQFSPWAAALAATLVLAVITAIYWRNDALITAVGQQQTRVLRDGTRVLLNTDTRIEVDYDERARRVRLVRGEARFDVSKHPAWPFLVTVGNREIRALGTSFVVRHDHAEDFAVTLVEGQISVAAIAGNDESSAQTPQILMPGQRLVISRHHAPAVDRPELSRVTAWERGRVEFDETPLEDATAEMNRYTATRVTVADAEIARLRIGGEFRAGDSEEFVKIVTAAFGLQAERNGDDIVLSRSALRPSPAADP